MNCTADEEATSFYRNIDNNDSESSENFQKFITELFEKNGILNDLRAYLRGHIVDVLKSAETGVPSACQKHFTQRLELVYQALNMLIAEYLLRMDFSYSMSVFVSEIPLANMVFDFARNLLQTADANMSGLRFQENDVWSVLHYLEIKCDSAHASKIIEMYKSGEAPLLCCILKCIPLYHKETSCLGKAFTSEEYLSSQSLNSADSHEDKPVKRKELRGCKHHACCRSCQSRFLRLKEKYRNRKTKMEKSPKVSSVNSFTVQSFMNSVGVMEKGLVDEMFHQLKTVYEAEVEMIKEEEERKIKRSIANHALLLQKHREELEESFKARQAELEKNVNQKKKFLWGLARALRSQHEHMTAAMRSVQYETEKLAEKESTIKVQLGEAEQTLKKRSEEMRCQISQELILLETHLETMKRERESINKERDELENLKNIYENNSKIMKQQDFEGNQDLKSHYKALKDEMVVLRSYIESKGSKCFIERGTVMDLGDGVMNNSVGVKGDDDDDRLKGSQVINDLKKPKNVNFSQSNLDEIYRQLSRTPSRSISGREESSQIRGSNPDCVCNRGCVTVDSSCGCDTVAGRRGCDTVDSRRGCDGCCQDTVLRLQEENDRLKNFARQQREHIDALSSERDRLQTRYVTSSRPRTAPSVMENSFFVPSRLNPTTSVNGLGWRKGAGEELNIFSAEPRVLLPGDAVPFIGVLRDRNDTRRQLISQWRALRRRLSPQTRPRAVPKEPPTLQRTDILNIDPQVLNVSGSGPCTDTHIYNSAKPQHTKPEVNKPREKSPKSVLREAKQKLKNNVTKEPPAPRDKSPNAVLREAKMRLRKLEIEAEAVEQSYLDFRKRQSALREERQHLAIAESDIIDSVSKIVPQQSTSKLNISENIAANNTFDYEKTSEAMKMDFDKYLLDYQTKYDLGQIHYQNKNSYTQRTKPIPSPYTHYDKNEELKTRNTNYLETPLTEFRKLYQMQKKNKQNYAFNSKSSNLIETPESDKNIETISENNKIGQFRNITNNKREEFKILQDNINKIYNLPETSTPNETKIDSTSKTITMEKIEIKNIEVIDKIEDKENKLTLQVETVNEVNNIGVTDSKKEILIVVESSIDNGETDSSETDNEERIISPQITVIVSPKRNRSPEITPREISQKLDITNKDISIIDMELDLSKEQGSMIEKDLQQEEYCDDFSADVDNYNSISDGGKNSPISLPKTEDESIWDN